MRYRVWGGIDLGAILSDLETAPMGLAYDREVAKLYWAADTAVRAASEDGSGMTTIYSDPIGRGLGRGDRRGSLLRPVHQRVGAAHASPASRAWTTSRARCTTATSRARPTAHGV